MSSLNSCITNVNNTEFFFGFTVKNTIIKEEKTGYFLIITIGYLDDRTVIHPALIMVLKFSECHTLQVSSKLDIITTKTNIYYMK